METKLGGIRELQTHNDLDLHVFTGECSTAIMKATSRFTTDSDFHGEYTTLVRNNNDPVER